MKQNMPYAGYLFIHFTGFEQKETDEQLYFAISKDGRIWHDLHADGHPVLTSTVGEKGVRDPFLIRDPRNNHFHILATDLSIFHRGGWNRDNPAVSGDGSLSLVIWDSPDLVHWSSPRLVDVASTIPDARMVWAPEACWDPRLQQFLVYWATTSVQDDQDPSAGDPTNMYLSTTVDFKHFSKPVKWIDRPQSCIDTTMIRADDGWYYRVSADRELAVEKTLDPSAITIVPSGDGYQHGSNPHKWEFVGYFRDLVKNPKGTGEYLEGPEFFRYNPQDRLHINGRVMKYGLMWDQYREQKGYLPFASANLGSGDPADWVSLSMVDLGRLVKRHGTILPITAREMKALREAYGNE